MPVTLSKSAIDLGIVTNNPDAMLGFYRDLLGFRYEASVDMPGGTTMHRLWCGESLIKILQHRNPPPASAPPGGIQGATGYRYWTMIVSNLDEIVEECKAAGAEPIVGPVEIRPGVKIAIVEDPDGNWVEFVAG